MSWNWEPLEPPAAYFRVLQQEFECRLQPNIEEITFTASCLGQIFSLFKGTDMKSFENVHKCHLLFH